MTADPEDAAEPVGDTACWLDAVCTECGAFVEDEVCARCGATRTERYRP